MAMAPPIPPEPPLPPWSPLPANPPFPPKERLVVVKMSPWVVCHQGCHLYLLTWLRRWLRYSAVAAITTLIPYSGSGTSVCAVATLSKNLVPANEAAPSGHGNAPPSLRLHLHSVSTGLRCSVATYSTVSAREEVARVVMLIPASNVMTTNSSDSACAPAPGGMPMPAVPRRQHRRCHLEKEFPARQCCQQCSSA